MEYFIMNIKSNETISAQVAKVMSNLKKGHTRSEAFAAINNARIDDRNGRRIVPSVWYHALAYNMKENGKTYMEESYPYFQPTESPYPRIKTAASAPAPPAPAPVHEASNKDDALVTFLHRLRDDITSFIVSVEENGDKTTAHTGIKSSEMNIGNVVQSMIGKRRA
jgi:hypothetical protein